MNGNIFLIGPMGVGKSTIGRHLAEILHQHFIDSDHEIEIRTGVTIPLIFEYEGENGFRKREQEVIVDVTNLKNIILSTGGGVVLNPVNRRVLKNRGYVIYLHADVDDLLERTANNDNRPLLKTGNPRAKLETLLKQRHSLYTEIADVVIRTGKQSIQEVVTAVLNDLGEEE
jgi:shikimate kinase